MAMTQTVCSLVLAAAAVSAAREPLAGAAAPVGLIFDTDMGNDVDDALALGVAHALHSRGLCRLLAVTVTKDHPLAAPFVQAVNTFYGRGDIPIGVVRDGKTREPGKFLGMVTRRTAAGDFVHPHALAGGDDASEAAAVLRQVLAAAADDSVAIVQVGFSTNLARLLASGPDGASPLSGPDLVRRKVRLLSLMAGAFAPIPGTDRHCEYNVVQDIPAARAVIDTWPTAVVFSGYEIGIALPYPASSIEQDYGYAAHHPLAEAYRLFLPPPHCRPTWDLTSVLHAVLPQAGYFVESAPGRVTVEDDGYTRFREEPGGRHRILKLPPERAARTLEALVLLASQPPAATNR